MYTWFTSVAKDNWFCRRWSLMQWTDNACRHFIGSHGYIYFEYSFIEIVKENHIGINLSLQVFLASISPHRSKCTCEPPQRLITQHLTKIIYLRYLLLNITDNHRVQFHGVIGCWGWKRLKSVRKKSSHADR